MEQLIRFPWWSWSRMSAIRRVLLPSTKVTEIDLISDPKGVFIGSRNLKITKNSIQNSFFCCNSKCWSVQHWQKSLCPLLFHDKHFWTKHFIYLRVSINYMDLSVINLCKALLWTGDLSIVYLSPHVPPQNCKRQAVKDNRCNDGWLYLCILQFISNHFSYSCYYHYPVIMISLSVTRRMCACSLLLSLCCNYCI